MVMLSRNLTLRTTVLYIVQCPERLNIHLTCKFSVAAVTTNLVAYNNTNLFIYTAGGQKHKISFSGLMSRSRQSTFLQEAGGKNFVSLHLQPLVAAAFLGSWPLLPSSELSSFQSVLLSSCHFLHFCCQISFCLSLPLLKTLVIIVRAHLDKPG